MVGDFMGFNDRWALPIRVFIASVRGSLGVGNSARQARLREKAAKMAGQRAVGFIVSFLLNCTGVSSDSLFPV